MYLTALYDKADKQIFLLLLQLTFYFHLSEMRIYFVSWLRPKIPTFWQVNVDIKQTQ